MGENTRDSGIELIGHVPWGTHFCQFYETKEDLSSILVPFFMAGLRSNEFCMWVTAEPLEVEDATGTLRAAMPDFDAYLDNGQIEIIPYQEWYLAGGAFDSQRVLDGWIGKLNDALNRGFEGLRLTGNTFWLEKANWTAFLDYEHEVNNIIGNYKMLAICTYSLDKCNAGDILDVMNTHQFALIKEGGEWKIIESADHTRIESILQENTILRHEAELKFKNTFDHAIEGICHTTLDGRFIAVNPAFAKMFGYDTPEDFLNNASNARDLYAYPDRRDELFEIMQRDGVVIGFENAVRHRDGNIFWVLANVRPIVDTNENIIGYEGFFNNITVLKQAEERLKKNEEELNIIRNDLERLVQERTEQLESTNKRLANAQSLIMAQAAQNQLLADISNIPAEVKFEYQVLLDTIVAKAVQFMADTCAIRLISDDGKELSLVAYENVNPEVTASIREMIDNHVSPIDEGIPGQVVQTGQPILLADINEEDYTKVGPPGFESYSEEYGYSSILAVPLNVHGSIIGVLAMSRMKSRPSFSEDDESFLQNLADRAALAIENSRLFQKNKEALERIRETSQELRERSNYDRNLIEASLDPLVTIDADGKITDVNKATEQATGYSRDELIGSDFSEYFTEPEKARAGYQQVFTEGTVHDYPLAIRNRSGNVIDVSYNATVYTNESGDIQGVFAAARDVTERIKAEQKIHQQAELLDNAHDAITLRDLENRILYWNKGSERLYGWNASDVIGKISHEILFKGDYSQALDALKTVKDSGEWKGEMTHQDRDGKEIIVDSRWTLMYDADGNPESILVINSDITEKKRLEKQLLRTQRMESIGTLASGIAHDMNNILTPITMAIDLFKETHSDDESQKILEILETNAHRATDLTKQILSFARGVEGERHAVQIDTLITEVEKTIKETFPRSIDIQADVPSDLLNITGDYTQLHQVLMNLCVNARDAMPFGGTLTISAVNLSIDVNYATMNPDAKPGMYVVISVTDTGTGMPPAIMDRIFEPFFTTKKQGEGTGLGLPTSLGIVKGHGGFIHVYSEVGRGSTFKVFLPSISVVEESEKEQQLIGDLQGNGELILVVDDEEMIRTIITTALVKNGYTTLVASDGAEAVAVYAQERDNINAVILDMMMPVMDGYACIRALRKLDPGAKIIGVSGLGQNGKHPEIASRTTSFLAKPFTTEKLLRAVRDILSPD